jgi:hypothetical protein
VEAFLGLEAGVLEDFQAIGPLALAIADFGWIAGLGEGEEEVEGLAADFGAFGVFAAVAFLAGAAGVDGAGVAGAAGGLEGVAVASSGKESYPRPVRLRLEELLDAKGLPAGRVNLGARGLRIVKGGDGERLGEAPLGEELAGDEDRLVRLGEPLELADVDRTHLMPPAGEPSGYIPPDRRIVGLGGLAKRDEEVGKFRVVLADRP